MAVFQDINDPLLEASLYGILKELQPMRILDIAGTLGRMHCSLPTHTIAARNGKNTTENITLDMGYVPEIDALTLPDYSFTPAQTDVYGAIYSPAIPPNHAYHITLLANSFDFSDDTLLETLLLFAKMHSTVILLETATYGITKPENLQLFLQDWDYQYDALPSGNRLFYFIHK